MNTTTDNNTVVAVYGSHPETEAAIRKLQQSGFDMTKLSIVARDLHRTNTWSATTTPATA